jgi:hypothetical protein
VNTYAIWFDLVDSSEDLSFSRALQAFLGHFQAKGLVAGYTLERRKFGFGPSELGEFHVRIQTESLDLLDQAFSIAATRDGEIEGLHSEVFRRVKNFRSGLYRTFPDSVRVQ